MTQARDLSQKLYLQLRPRQLPDTNPQPVVKVDERSLDSSPLAAILAKGNRVSGTEIVLYPGELNEVLIQLKNLGNRSLELGELWIEIEGSFPSSWRRIIDMEGNPLPTIIDFFKEVVIFVIFLLIRAGLYRFVSLLHNYLEREREDNLFLWSSQVELSPQQKLEAILNFKIDEDWFESEKSLASREALVLDYQGRFYISYPASETQRSKTLVSTEFNLYVRPRSLYLNFLPEIYRKVDLIGRLLKIFEQAFEPDVQALDALWAYLNPLIAPKALLPFLAHWVGWNLTPELNEIQKRLLISQAMEIYRWRGTRKGLRHYLHLYTGLPLDEDLPEEEKAISIQENFRRDFILGKTCLGDERNAYIEGGQPYHFIVRLRFSVSLWREALICYSYSSGLSLRLWFLSFLRLRFPIFADNLWRLGFPENLWREALICYSYSSGLSLRLWFLSFIFFYLDYLYLNQIKKLEQVEPFFFFTELRLNH